jgi:HSP20 family protein
VKTKGGKIMGQEDHPLSEFSAIQDIVDKTLDRAFSGFFMPGRVKEKPKGMLPACDLIDRGDRLVLRVEVPGLKRENLDISVDGSSVSLKGEIRHEVEDKEMTHYRSERYYGSFSRLVELPVEVNPDDVDARLKDGILEVTLPKKEVSKARRVEIKIK